MFLSELTLTDTLTTQYFGALARTEEGSTQPVTGSLLNYVSREPIGVCALISSFNHPALISCKKLGPFFVTPLVI